jgi:hypothetical protein
LREDRREANQGRSKHPKEPGGIPHKGSSNRLSSGPESRTHFNQGFQAGQLQSSGPDEP